MSEISDKVMNFAKPIVEDLGYELVEVEYAKKFDGYTLTLFIYNKDNPITLNDCEKVSRTLDEPLDELDPTKGQPYNFNVSSLGLDRPIKTDGDFSRNINKEIEIKLYSPIDKKKQYVGYLRDFNKDTITLEIKGNKIIEITRAQIAKANLAIHF